MGLIFSLCKTNEVETSSEVIPFYIPLLKRPMFIIGITGKAGSGKDTLADHIVKNYGFEKKSFAGPLKKGVSELFSISMETLNDTVAKEQENPVWNKSPRQLMQWLGTDILRKYIRDDFFIASLANDLNNSTSHRIVISDVRFDKEAEYLKYLGVPIIRIETGMRKTIATMGKKEAKHSSENGISERLIDYTIINDTTIDDLKYTFDNVIAENLKIL